MLVSGLPLGQYTQLKLQRLFSEPFLFLFYVLRFWIRDMIAVTYFSCSSEYSNFYHLNCISNLHWRQFSHFHNDSIVEYKWSLYSPSTEWPVLLGWWFCHLLGVLWACGGGGGGGEGVKKKYDLIRAASTGRKVVDTEQEHSLLKTQVKHNRRFPEITGKDNLTVFSYSGRVNSPEWRWQLRRADLRQF